MDEYSIKCYIDILNAGNHIYRFCRGHNYESFSEDDLVFAAVERKFEIIGEALNRIKKRNPEDLSILASPQVIIDFRNVLAHAYDKIDTSVMWGVIEYHLPELLTTIEAQVDIKNIKGLDLFKRE